MNWQIDDARFVSQQHADFVDLPERDYWSKTFRTRRHFFAKNYDQFIMGFDDDFVYFDYLEYFDTVKLTRYSGKILLALSNIYNGAAIDRHGVVAPDAWEWFWDEDAMELCLKLDETVERAARVETETICLPHIKRQLAELEKAETKQREHST